jgi:hypothetical protein
MSEHGAAGGRFSRVAGQVARVGYRLVRAAVRAVAALVVRLSSAETRPRWMNRLPGNRFALAGLVVLAVAALYGVASFARPAASAPRRGTEVPVSSAYAACPDVGGARVSAVTPPGARGTGQASVPGAPVMLTTPGTAWSTDVKKAGPWVFGASGSLAPGLTAEQTTTDGGLAGTRCVQPATDLWFAGPGPADAEDVGLYLTNVDDRPVTAVVSALSPEGSIETPEGEDDVVVAPHSTRLVQLGVQVEGFGQAAADAKLVAVHVHAMTGRVAAAVEVRRKKGADWLPATTPSRNLVVPGVPSGKGRRRLLVAVPGEDPVAVTAQGMARGGTSAPTGGRPLQATALAVTAFDLGLGGSGTALRLTAARPIVAAVVADEGDDFAVTTAVPPLRASAAGLVADARADTTLLLSAPPGHDAAVRLTRLGAQGVTGAGQDVRVPAGHTVEVPGGGADALLIAPRPGSGPVYAARLLKMRKKGLTVLPVPPARMTALLPSVADSTIP